MSIFMYLVTIGIIQLVYGFIWQYLALLIGGLFVILKQDRFGAYFVKGLGYYIFISLIALLTLAALKDNQNLTSLVLFALVGLFAVFMAIGGGMNEGRKQATESGAFHALEFMQYDSIFLLASMGVFLLILFIPSLGVNFFTRSAFTAIEWVSNLPIIGFLLGIGGFLYLLNMGFHALVIGAMSIAALFGKLKGSN